MKEVEMISCSICGNPMPKLRLTRFGYKHCVQCSTEKPKVALTTVYGSGDHTWNDIVVMDQDTAKSLAEKEAEILGKKVYFEELDYDEDDSIEAPQQANEKVRKYLKDLEDQEDDDDEEVLEDLLEEEDDSD